MSGVTRLWSASARLLAVVVRRLAALCALALGSLIEASEDDVPIKPPRYSSRLTGESFEKYDPLTQDAARLRRIAADAARKKAAKVASGEAAPIREVRRA